MKKGVLFVLLFWAALANAQFPLTPIQWPTPQGGYNYQYQGDSMFYGFCATSGTPYNYGTEAWNLIDMNGDGKPDLVVTGYDNEANGGDILTQFNASSNPYWLVYLNTENGFSPTPIQWTTPRGGHNYESNGIKYAYGFYNITGYIESFVYPARVGQTAWNLVDMNGDGKPDLVVTAYGDSANNGQATQFRSGNYPFWNVYLNTGSGFSTTSIQWFTPMGGLDDESNGISNTFGFCETKLTIGNPTFGAQSWTLADMNGDGKPDLVITASSDSLINYGYPAQFDAQSNPHWLIYLNTGSGFAATSTQWPTPLGGSNYRSWTYDYWGKWFFCGFSITDGGGGGYGAQSWGLHDMNGDGRPDLVVMGVEDSANGGLTQFQADGSPYWMVYLNTDSGFSAAPIQWPTPIGGANYETGGNLHTYGFNNVSGDLGYSGAVPYYGAQVWRMLDINGDGKPDLVVTGYYDSTVTRDVQFSVNANPYWMVYLNTGTGFLTTATRWETAMGGDDWETAGIDNRLGFYNISGPFYGNGSKYGIQTWDLADMNGDGKPDLVVTAYTDSLNQGSSTQYNASTNPYWNVYLNSFITGTGVPEVTNLSDNCVLYPNPNNGNFTLLFTDATERSIEIYDLMGRLIIPPVSIQNKQQFDLGAISAGIYLLRITQNNEEKNLKFSVVR